MAKELDPNVYEQAFHQAAIAFAVVDLDRNFLLVNQFFADLTGYSREELQQMNVSELTHPEDLPKNIKLDDEVIAKKIDHFEYEKRYIRKNGEIFWGLLTATVEKDENGEPQQFIAQVQDISERKELESKRRLEAMMDLISTYNHEINNPLAIAIAAADILKVEKDFPENIQRNINTLTDAVWRISKVLHKIQAVVKEGNLEFSSQGTKTIKI